MKILVTGGTGYIGSHTIVELLNSGFEVVALDNLSNSSILVLDGIKKITGKSVEFHKINLANIQETELFFKENSNFDGIIHFAAYKAVGESVVNPLMYYENNLFALVNLLKAMQTYAIKNLVFSSSCTVYGQPDCLPVTELTPLKKADSPYGNTKQMSEDIIESTMKAHSKFRAIALRYFNPIGAHKSGEIGELPTGTPNNLVPFITQTAIGKRSELSIFGKDYSTSDGTAVRDYIHVVDLAQAHIAAINYLTTSKSKENYEIFNIGTGKGNSVLEVVETFEKVNNIKLNYKFVGRRVGDVEEVWADASLAFEKLGWSAKKTLEDALSSAWNWEQKFAKC